MMYPFMTLDDNTEIVHSEMQPDHRVKVYIEKPDEKDCFHSAVCYLPDYTWEDVSGFTPAEIDRYQKVPGIHCTSDPAVFPGRRVENAAGFKIGSYWVYFWANENDPLEPIHVHVSQGAPSSNATKIWITRAGKCYLCHNNSNIPPRVLRNIMAIIEARSDEVIAKWMNFFGEVRYFC